MLESQNVLLFKLKMYNQNTSQEPPNSENRIGRKYKLLFINNKPFVDEKQELFQMKLPRKYNVIFISDDFTPLSFIIKILEVIFNKSLIEAEVLIQNLHNDGKAIVGTYILEVAQTKQAQTLFNAQKRNFPLTVELIPEELQD
ncbi:ATP-dependent Clp protease adaptor ClpS [archaeon]|nr:ATP-dependent Clp protease adaptor ClpS [archaeon]NCQ51703.1 ATP-dependent Clp protease adaptor ClpS [archaeon]